jgi:hypothetical protein
MKKAIIRIEKADFLDDYNVIFEAYSGAITFVTPSLNDAKNLATALEKTGAPTIKIKSLEMIIF